MLGVSLFISCKNKIQCVCVEKQKQKQKQKQTKKNQIKSNLAKRANDIISHIWAGDSVPLRGNNELRANAS